jgi:hypothetical protein
MFNETIFSIGVTRLELRGIDNESLCRKIRHCSTNPNKNKSNPRGIDIDDPVIKDLNGIVLQQSQNILEGMAPKPSEGKLETYFKRVWGNHNLNYDICTPHTHRDSFLSAVYYPKSTDGIIEFYSPWMDAMLSHIPWDYPNNGGAQNTTFNSSHYYFNVQTGWLILFPATLCHFVPACNDERYSIAYDVGIRYV